MDVKKGRSMPNLAHRPAPAPLTEGQILFLAAVRETLTDRGAAEALAIFEARSCALILAASTP